MQISDQQFSKIRERYGYHSSWAIWRDRSSRPLDGIGDLSVFDFTAHPENRELLHANFIIIGLNFSVDTEGRTKDHFTNFHSPSRWGKDYKMRDAFKDTPLWGAYMTDILKDYIEVSSANVAAHLRAKPDALETHYAAFDEELEILGAQSSVLVPLGGLTCELVARRYGSTRKILKLPHYSARGSSEAYIANVHQALKSNGM